MAVTSALQSLPGVATLQIDASARTVVVGGDSEKFEVSAAVSALEESGYPAETTENLTES